jgi:hypothetical protein
VESLVAALEGANVHVVWDQHLGDDESISRFVDEARRLPVTIALVGPRYLRSRWCVSEMHAVHESSACEAERFRLRFMPVFLDGACCDEPEDRSRHGRHWQDRADTLLPQKPGYQLAEKDYGMGKRMDVWGKWLADALEAVADKKLPRGWAANSADGFRELLGRLERHFRELGVG